MNMFVFESLKGILRLRPGTRNSLLAISLVCVTLFSCATAPGNVPTVGDASELRATSVAMIANPTWGDAVRIAEFTPNTMWQGASAIEIALPYGETAVAYVFDGFSPGAVIEIEMAVNLDFFMQDSFISLAYLSGRWNAADAVFPRPHISEHVQHKWIDSVGRFAGEPWPDATEGWETVTGTATADETGAVTLMMIINHWTETPPVTYAHFRNPEARQRANN